MKKLIIASIIALGLAIPNVAEARDGHRGNNGHGNNSHYNGKHYDKYHGHGKHYSHNHRNHKDWNKPRIVVHQPVAYYNAPYYRPYHPQAAYYSYYSAYPRPVYYTTPSTHFSFNF